MLYILFHITIISTDYRHLNLRRPTYFVLTVNNQINNVYIRFIYLGWCRIPCRWPWAGCRGWTPSNSIWSTEVDSPTCLWMCCPRTRCPPWLSRKTYRCSACNGSGWEEGIIYTLLSHISQTPPPHPYPVYTEVSMTKVGNLRLFSMQTAALFGRRSGTHQYIETRKI